MKTLDAIINVVEFLYSAVKTYAETPEGQAHLDKIAADLGVDDNQQTVQVGDVSYPAGYGENPVGPRVVRNS